MPSLAEDLEQFQEVPKRDPASAPDQKNETSASPANNRSISQISSRSSRFRSAATLERHLACPIIRSPGHENRRTKKGDGQTGPCFIVRVVFRALRKGSQPDLRPQTSRPQTSIPHAFTALPQFHRAATPLSSAPVSFCLADHLPTLASFVVPLLPSCFSPVGSSRPPA